MVFFLGIGREILKGYLGDLLEFGADSILSKVRDLIKKYGEKDIIECFPSIFKDINDKILNKFDEIMDKNIIDYKKETQYFREFKKDKVVNEIRNIIKKLFENVIKEKAKNAYQEKAQIGKEFGLLNILLKGDDRNIKKFIEIFNINKNDKNEYYFNNEIDALKDKIGQIRLYDNKNVNKNNIDYIWEFIEVSKIKNEIKDKDNSKIDNISDNIPIIYIYFKDDLDIQKIDIFTKLGSSVDNLNYKRLFENFIINTDNISNNKDKKCLFDLVEKTVLNIIINKYKADKEKKSKEKINEIIAQKRKCSFGNKIDYLYIMNFQEVQSIFKDLLDLSEEDIKLYRNFIKHLLKDYQQDIIEVKDTFLSNVFNKIVEQQNLKSIIEDDNSDANDDIKQLRKEIMNAIRKSLSYKEDNKKKGNQNIYKVNSIKIDSINKIIITKLEDYLLQTSCCFINELITSSITERIIELYNIRIIHNYYTEHNNEYVFINCKEKK